MLNLNAFRDGAICWDILGTSYQQSLHPSTFQGSRSVSSSSTGSPLSFGTGTHSKASDSNLTVLEHARDVQHARPPQTDSLHADDGTNDSLPDNVNRCASTLVGSGNIQCTPTSPPPPPSTHMWVVTIMPFKYVCHVHVGESRQIYQQSRSSSPR